MLNAGLAADLRAGFERTIEVLGVPAVWRQAVAPQAALAVTVGAKLVGRDDREVINAVGIGGRILTVKAADFGALSPEKFDTFEIGGQTYVANTVHQVLLNDELIGWKVMARAQG